MTRRREVLLIGVLWTACGLLAACIPAYVAFILSMEETPLHLPDVLGAGAVQQVRQDDPAIDILAGKPLSRKIPEPPPAAAPPPPPATPIESLLKLKGVMDYAGRQPSVAVIELLAEQKIRAFLPGEKLGQSGAVLVEAGETVIVEYALRRYRLTYKDIREVPTAPVGLDR